MTYPYRDSSMLRNNVSSSMQKTYDECYLICSTAVYYEAQVKSHVDLGKLLGLIQGIY